jgi:hypothetical protein
LTRIRARIQEAAASQSSNAATAASARTVINISSSLFCFELYRVGEVTAAFGATPCDAAPIARVRLRTPEGDAIWREV